MKIYSNGPVTGWDGEAIQVPMGEGKPKSTELRHLLSWIMNNTPTNTMKDADAAASLAKSIRDAENKMNVELEDASYQWIIDNAEAIFPPVLRQNARIVLNHLKEKQLDNKAKEKSEETKE